MMSRYCQMLFGLLVTVACMSTGCNVSFKDLQKGETFKCAKDRDCIEGFVCNKESNRCVEACSGNSDCGKDQVCKDQICVPGCIDEDGDGYGSSESEALGECDACKQGKPKACQTPDCKDGDGSIHPGVPETCDRTDNNCNGSTDEPVTCSGPGSCPTLLSAPSDRNGTRIGCKSVDRSGKTQKECVLVGKFTRNNCNIDKNKATCQKGSWGKIPKGCTQSQ
ncbi:MAG: putative metal-binding motif-containing protein [Bradymonadaceae bacterium]